MAKKRTNFTISRDVKDILRRIKKTTGKSESQLVENAIRKTYSNPIDELKEEKRKFAIQMSYIDKRIKDLEEKK